MDECDQDLCSKLSTVWNNNSCNASICSELLVAHCNSGSVWCLLCIQFFIHSTHIGAADSSREVHISLWSHFAVPRHWKPAGTATGRFVQNSLCNGFFSSKSDSEFARSTLDEYNSSVFISSVTRVVGITLKLAR